MQSLTNATICPRLGIEAKVAETTETRFPQGIRGLWWRCQACGGWHLCLDHQDRSSEAMAHHQELAPLPA